MGKTKQKQKSEIEYLKGIINALKKENKLLKSQGGRSLNDEPEDFNHDNGTCTSCGKGDVITLDLKFIKIHTCNICGVTTKEKHT